MPAGFINEKIYIGADDSVMSSTNRVLPEPILTEILILICVNRPRRNNTLRPELKRNFADNILMSFFL